MGQSPEERQLTEDIAATREDLSRNLDALTDRVSPSRIVERRKDAVRGRFQRMRDNVMGAGSSGSVSGTADSVSETAQGAVDTVTQRAQGNPLAAGLVAFGMGALVGSLLPASEKEAQAAQRVVDFAKEQGQPVLEEAKSVGQEVGQHLKEQASQAADQVKQSAQSSAQSVSEEGRSAAESVKEDARPTRS
ncbi:MAG TPA: DUF3618 domain-containing protein [Candidatus Limnocylindrales bacterium]